MKRIFTFGLASWCRGEAVPADKPQNLFIWMQIVGRWCRSRAGPSQGSLGVLSICGLRTPQDGFGKQSRSAWRTISFSAHQGSGGRRSRKRINRRSKYGCRASRVLPRDTRALPFRIPTENMAQRTLRGLQDDVDDRTASPVRISRQRSRSERRGTKSSWSQSGKRSAKSRWPRRRCHQTRNPRRGCLPPWEAA